jgi:hypothetical protein
LQAVTATLAPHVNEPGLPAAVKFSFKSGEDLKPDTVCTPGAALKTYTFTIRVPATAGACGDLQTLCGGTTCLTALADKSYDSCPAYTTSGKAACMQLARQRMLSTAAATPL